MRKAQDDQLAKFFADAFHEVVIPPLEKIDERLDRIETKLDKIDHHLERHDKKLDNHEKRITSLETVALAVN